MNNKTLRIILSVMLIASFATFFSSPTHAATATATATSSPSTVHVGDNVTVTIRYNAANIYAVLGNFNYDKSSLQYVSHSGFTDFNTTNNGFLFEASQGTSSVAGSITFKALKNGNSNVSFSVDDFINWDGATLGKPSASKTISVTPKPAPTPAPSQPKPQPAQPSQPVTDPEPIKEDTNPVEDAIEVTVSGTTYFMWTDLTTVTLPRNFSAQEVTYEGEDVGMAVADEKDLTLAYLTDGDGENGNFFVYEANSNNLYPYFTFKTEHTYTILELDSSVTLPEGFIVAELTLNDQTLQAWQNESGENPDFYLLYAMNSEGEKGLYLYDKSEDTIQRYFDKTIIVEVETEPEPVGFFERLFNDGALMGTVVTLSILNLGLISFLAFTFFSPKKRRSI